MPMDFSTIALSDLKRLVPLIEERDAVTARLAEINNALSGLNGSSKATPTTKPVSKAKAAVTKKPAKGRKGAIKDAIVKILQEAPSSGISVENIAKSVGKKSAAMHVWFYTTGKSIKEIKKVGRGIYAWTGDKAQ